MEDRDWLILKLLFEQQNITKTAQALYISQPTLTTRLQQIEKEYGVKIVQRGRRGVQFTPEGEYLAKCADEVLVKLRQIHEHVSNMNNKVAGTLRLGVSNYFTTNKLPGLLKRFRSEFPDVEFKVMTGWSKDVYSMIYNHDVHIGFVRGSYEWGGSKQLLFDEPVCVASSRPVALDELPSLPRIDYQTDPLFKALIDSWWAENYVEPPHIGMVVDRGETCKKMVMNGLGFAILPRLVIEDAQELYTLDLTDTSGNPISRSTWMFYHEESLHLNMVKAFVRFVEKLDVYSLM